ncbi:MAG: gamma-glutamyl-gamma-aminobutyrate hydrolase family protein [Eubacterium sp.]|nr:gamma-glutamyl-gamma-aminobutyrate hydrolase family protein [Eubacterium sp.]
MKKPLIGITPLYDYNLKSWWIIPGYLEGVLDAGGIPVMLPFTDDEDAVKALIHKLDGIIFTGGPDSDPALYGEKPVLKLGSTAPIRDITESLYFKYAYEKDLPILGICRGMQLMNILLGGSVWQDQPSQFPSEINHDQTQPNYIASHSIDIIPGTPIADWFNGKKELEVNSFHHQVLNRLAKGVEVMAYAKDEKIIEAIYIPEKKFCCGLQWHPETLRAGREEQNLVFHALIRASADNSL